MNTHPLLSRIPTTLRNVDKGTLWMGIQNTLKLMTSKMLYIDDDDDGDKKKVNTKAMTTH